MTDYLEGQMSIFDVDGWSGKMYPEHFHPEPRREKTSVSSLKKRRESHNQMPLFLDLRGGGKNQDVLKLVFLIVSILGGVLLLIKYNDNWITKAIGKGFWKHAYYGTYMILAGWVVGLVGWVTKK